MTTIGIIVPIINIIAAPVVVYCGDRSPQKTLEERPHLIKNTKKEKALSSEPLPLDCNHRR